MIRRASQSDLAEAVAFATQFHAESVHSYIPIVPQVLEAWMADLIGQGIVYLSERGIIGGLLSPIYFNPDYKVAVELFWWAPVGGHELRKAFEAWAVEQGANSIQFSGQRNERAEIVEKLFRRAGYAPVETGFVKRV